MRIETPRICNRSQATASNPQIELRFLEAVAERLPEDDRVLKPLGDLYTASGRLQEGLAVDRRLVVLCPGEPSVWYNLGCSLALVGETDAAFDALHAAIDRGYRDRKWLIEDEDLSSLRGDPRFKEVTDRLVYPGKTRA